MAKKDPRTPEQKIKSLELELEARNRELMAIRRELGEVNQQLEQFILQMSGELKLASLIQKSLVPTEIPTIPGFEFSTKFVPSLISGGDYFDIFEHQDKMRFGILLANSSGHGMASLFLSVLLKLTAQIEARKGMEPEAVLNHMTKEIQENLTSGGQANVFYAVIDRRRYTLSYAKAGVGPAFLYKRASDKLIKLESTQAAISKDSVVSSEKEVLSLEPRDKLILATEGVTRALNKDDEAFGDGRLYEALLKNPTANCHEMRNEIFFQLSKFVKGREYIQDLSVLIMEVQDKVIKLRKG